MRRAILWSGTAALLLAAGCAEESDPGLETDAAPTAGNAPAESEPVPASNVAVTLSDSTFQLSPDHVRSGAVSFHLRNGGAQPHALAVRGGSEEWSSLELAPGDSVTMSVGLAAGRYELSCPLTQGGSHAARGERSVLRVE